MRKRTKGTVREAMACLEAHQRELDDAKGHKTQGEESKPKRGRPCKCAYGEPQDRVQSNFMDPESAIMKTSNDGFQQCYNAQLAVDGENQIIVATQVTADATDRLRFDSGTVDVGGGGGRGELWCAATDVAGRCGLRE